MSLSSHSHAHSNHAHSHAHGAAHPAQRPGLSLLRMTLAQRLAFAAVASLAMWAIIAAASL